MHKFTIRHYIGIILLLCLTATKGQAQIINSIAFQRGYIITYTDSLQGYVGLKDLNSGKIKFKHQLNDKKSIRIHPRDIVRVSIGEDIYEWVNYSRDKRLMKLLVSGKIKLYEDRYEAGSAGLSNSNRLNTGIGSRYVKRDYFIYKNDTFHKLKKNRFKITLQALTEENNSLKDKINSLNFYDLNPALSFIIKQYNAEFK